MQKILNGFLLSVMLLYISSYAHAQQAPQLIINLAPIDGLDITAENCLNYQILSQSNKSEPVKIKGIMTWRNSTLRIEYSFTTTLQTGNNSFSKNTVNPTWLFSQSALKELFEQYRTLPEGTLQYCVEVYPNNNANEQANPLLAEECIYYQKNDLFLINLNEPENNAKIFEYNPLLSWTVNFPFAQDLTYTLKLTSAQSKQNNQTAITRNPLILKENNINGLSLMYPTTAKRLEAYTPYVWTVDAYYKGILLGGAEPWRFTILEDSLLSSVPKEQSYIEVNLEKGEFQAYAVGQLKLKFIESELKQEELKFSLRNEDGKELKLNEKPWIVKQGENRMLLPLTEVTGVKHAKKYTLIVTTSSGKEFKILFKYINPELL